MRCWVYVKFFSFILCRVSSLSLSCYAFPSTCCRKLKHPLAKERRPLSMSWCNYEGNERLPSERMTIEYWFSSLSLHFSAKSKEKLSLSISMTIEWERCVKIHVKSSSWIAWEFSSSNPEVNTWFFFSLEELLIWYVYILTFTKENVCVLTFGILLWFAFSMYVRLSFSFLLFFISN